MFSMDRTEQNFSAGKKEMTFKWMDQSIEIVVSHRERTLLLLCCFAELGCFEVNFSHSILLQIWMQWQLTSFIILCQDFVYLIISGAAQASPNENSLSVRSYDLNGAKLFKQTFFRANFATDTKATRGTV